MTVANRTPRILLSAYQCNPEHGSVSQIGWQWYFRLARRVPVTLLTHIRNRDALLRAGAPLTNSEVIFIDTEWFAGLLYHTVSALFPKTEYPVSLFSSLDFYLYDWVAVRQMKKRQKAGAHWDIVHEVTPVSPKAATRLHKLKCPVILGPWNGGLKVPLTFPKIVIQDLSWLYPIRYLGSLVDFAWRSTRHATVILTATQATLKSIPTCYHSRCLPVLENGVDLNIFTPTPWPPPPSDTEPLHILFVGRLVAFKGVSMLLEAVARYQSPVRLTIMGEGPLREQWQDLAIRLHINHLITWYGQATHFQVAEQLHAAHVLCLPSIRESGGAVILEAMACARPVLVIQYGGPAELVDEEVGYAIPPTGTVAVIQALLDCLHDIANYPDKWRRRGEAGRQRAERLYNWEDKIDKTLAIYQEVLQARQSS